jgi:hypothetical protein
LYVFAFSYYTFALYTPTVLIKFVGLMLFLAVTC